MKHGTARLLALCAIPLLIWLIYTAARWGVADLYYQPAVITLKKPHAATPPATERQSAEANLNKALKLDPHNPSIHEYLAAVMAMPAGAAAESEAALQQAMRHYRRSIALRPAWPYAWLGLAAAKYSAGQLDGEYYAALRQAARLGPSEQVVQRYIIELGLGAWANVPEENRLFTLGVIARAVRHSDRGHVRQALQIIQARGLLEAVCLLHRDEDIVDRYCRAQIPKR